MRVICTAGGLGKPSIENLCECVNILGGVPCVSGDTVCVEYEGETPKAEKFIELFEQYTCHGISIVE